MQEGIEGCLAGTYGIGGGQAGEVGLTGYPLPILLQSCHAFIGMQQHWELPD